MLYPRITKLNLSHNHLTVPSPLLRTAQSHISAITSKKTTDANCNNSTSQATNSPNQVSKHSKVSGLSSQASKYSERSLADVNAKMLVCMLETAMNMIMIASDVLVLNHQICCVSESNSINPLLSTSFLTLFFSL